MEKLILTTIALLEQKLEKLSAQAQQTANEIAEVKAHLTVVKCALEKAQDTTERIVQKQLAQKNLQPADLPKNIKLPDQASQTLNNWVNGADQSTKSEAPKRTLMPRPAKTQPAHAGKGVYKRALKIHPELCRTLVETYEDYRTDPRGYTKTEALAKIKSELNLPYAIETIKRAIFHHANNKGYEDIPTPSELPYRGDYVSEASVRDAKMIKFLLKYNLSNTEIAEMTECKQSKVSQIRSGVTFDWLNLLPDDEATFKIQFRGSLAKKGIEI